MKFIVHTDGGARGNPGPGAIGVVVEQVIDGAPKILAEFGKTIGESTNNVAEYTAVVEALRWFETSSVLRQSSEQSHIIEFFLDSQLVVNQLNGLFKVKNAVLRSLLASIRVLEQGSGATIVYRAVPREQNLRADFLVNLAFDAPKM